MYNFKSKLLILLLGIMLILPAIYCFSLISPSRDSKEVVDGSKVITIDVVPPTKINDTTEDSSISDGDTTEDSSSDDDGDTSEDSSTDDDDTSEEDSSTDVNDTVKKSATNDSDSSSSGKDTMSWPVIMIVEDDSGLVNAKSEFDSRRVDSNNNWLVINKRTSIRRVEEEIEDFGKNRKVFNEDKSEELRIYRDNIHTVIRHGVDLTNILRL